ncbi:procathepsin L-like [Mya arenaria]|uniref:procathepsin L-like n=1 Tax=Mya arenaria TaxID=6604 RepID=UPI0022E88A08|nr:procathepsin L-like [Mya arenaria]
MLLLLLKSFVWCLILPALVTSVNDDSDSFLEYLKTYGKSYTTANEFNKRFSIWQETVSRVERHNADASKGLHSYTMAVNQFSDMTYEEYRANMFGFKSDPDHVRNTLYQSSLSELPAAVDWKAKGYVTEVGNQGQCGSCWAFTATGALEGQHKKKTGILVDLSEQDLMDCTKKGGNYGCEGGFMDRAFEDVKEKGGIDTEQSYPYNQTNPGTQKCRYTVANRGATCTGYVDLPKGNETALQQALAEIGPISVAIDASHVGFQTYKTGVYDDPQCSPDRIDHSLLVVGYGTTKDGIQYYNCKNSWGTQWGDHGYVKIVRNKNNQCGVASTASYPTM